MISGRKKQRGETYNDDKEYKHIHMPNNTLLGFVMSVFFFIAGFGLVFYWYWLGLLGGLGVLACLAYRSFKKDDGYHVEVPEIVATEEQAAREFKTGIKEGNPWNL
ncbi:Quinol oxidase subunit 1 [Listeria cornellensis FSL F6-0969]|uniref:Quinol oxidase subunit 1 n=1 Tax=Listeria cornellensis FSL F6-0969 TaxID=1265820 RepID=W7BH57_9LIST|nr:Quinol oxidase subunit 1 [Listeria cornellensis FSL F6-0969]